MIFNPSTAGRTGIPMFASRSGHCLKSSVPILVLTIVFDGLFSLAGKIFYHFIPQLF
jgi:hypothetical protein